MRRQNDGSKVFLDSAEFAAGTLCVRGLRAGTSVRICCQCPVRSRKNRRNRDQPPKIGELLPITTSDPACSD